MHRPIAFRATAVGSILIAAAMLSSAPVMATADGEGADGENRTSAINALEANVTSPIVWNCARSTRGGTGTVTLVVDEQPAATIAHVMAATLANIRVMDMV